VGKEDFGRRCKKALLRCVTMCYKGRMPIKYNGQSIASIINEPQKRFANIDENCYSIERKIKPTNSLETTSEEMTSDEAELDFRFTLQQIYKETTTYLESLDRAASEGRASVKRRGRAGIFRFSMRCRLAAPFYVFNIGETR
jgi:hypothetical protein